MSTWVDIPDGRINLDHVVLAYTRKVSHASSLEAYEVVLRTVCDIESPRTLHWKWWPTIARAIGVPEAAIAAFMEKAERESKEVREVALGTCA